MDDTPSHSHYCNVSVHHLNTAYDCHGVSNEQLCFSAILWTEFLIILSFCHQNCTLAMLLRLWDCIWHPFINDRTLTESLHAVMFLLWMLTISDSSFCVNSWRLQTGMSQLSCCSWWSINWSRARLQRISKTWRWWTVKVLSSRTAIKRYCDLIGQEETSISHHS